MAAGEEACVLAAGVDDGGSCELTRERAVPKADMTVAAAIAGEGGER